MTFIKRNLLNVEIERGIKFILQKISLSSLNFLLSLYAYIPFISAVLLGQSFVLLGRNAGMLSVENSTVKFLTECEKAVMCPPFQFQSLENCYTAHN
jgi:hypothetical protein